VFHNYLDIKAGLEAGFGMVKSPFEKGGFRGISRSYIKSPLPPFSKGGLEIGTFTWIINCGTEQ
jgi:hypothetical protein